MFDEPLAEAPRGRSQEERAAARAQRRRQLRRRRLVALAVVVAVVAVIVILVVRGCGGSSSEQAAATARPSSPAALSTPTSDKAAWEGMSRMGAGWLAGLTGPMDGSYQARCREDEGVPLTAEGGSAAKAVQAAVAGVTRLPPCSGARRWTPC